MGKKRIKLNGEKAKSNAGRPPIVDSGVIAKLEQAFAIDATVEEACSYADISRDAFYDYLKVNPQFSNRIADLRQRPILKARQTVVQKVGESYQNAMDYLKRKRKDEFSEKHEADITTNGLPLNEFNESQIERIARRILNGDKTGTESVN